MTATEVLRTVLCPDGHFDNPGQNQFCTHCHATLFFRCPKCWHAQSTHSTCDKCGVDMDNLWRAQGAAAQAVLVKEESSNMEESSQRAVADINGVAMFLSNPIAGLSWIVSQEIFMRLRRFMNI